MMILIDQPPSFWQWNIGQLGTMITIIITLLGLHRSNTKRIQEETSLAQDQHNKIEDVHRWISDNGEDLITMKTKVNIMYDIWFKNTNVRNEGKSNG